MFHFVLVTVNNDALGLFEFERADWKPGDVIPGRGTEPEGGRRAPTPAAEK